MAFEHPGDGALDYKPCRYGDSKQLFRGPAKALDVPYAAFLGSTETYGRFIETPFSELVERDTGHRTVNLGCVNAGVDVYAQDPALLEIATSARLTVIQAMGAQNLSNRFYTVHPRRNDRFICPSAMMKTAFPEVDFTEFSFTRHLLSSLRQRRPKQFDLIVDELKTAWVARMKLLIAQIRGPIALLWIGDTAPPSTANRLVGDISGPSFVDRFMIDELRPLVDDCVIVVASAAAKAAGTSGMVFSELESPVATESPGVLVHQEAAAALAPVVRKYFD